MWNRKHIYTNSCWKHVDAGCQGLLGILLTAYCSITTLNQLFHEPWNGYKPSHCYPKSFSILQAQERGGRRLKVFDSPVSLKPRERSYWECRSARTEFIYATTTIAFLSGHKNKVSAIYFLCSQPWTTMQMWIWKTKSLPSRFYPSRC